MSDLQRSQINSAEMTAYWRTTEPIISNDKLSANLVSQEGINNAYSFVEKLNYHCVPRLISVRARYFLDQAVRLLKTNNYDACISFASGFSLLNNNIFNVGKFDTIKFYDTDLPHVVEIRKKRMDTLINDPDTKLNQHGILFPFDLNNLLSGDAIRKTFAEASSPLIILEGISYFIPNNVLNALFAELSLFNQFAIILDYFPDDSAKRSSHFRTHAQNITSFIPQIINTIEKSGSQSSFSMNVDDYTSVQEAEKNICETHNLSFQLVDENAFFPTQFIVLKK